MFSGHELGLIQPPFPRLLLVLSPLCCAGKASSLSAGHSLDGKSFLEAILP